MPQALPPGFKLGSVEPVDAVAAMADRGLLKPTFNWWDAWQEEHAAAFTVSGIARTDILVAIKTELDQALATGTNLADFAQAVKAVLVKAGWWGDVEITSPVTGEIRTTTFNDARLQLIYDTNLRQSYSAGRWAFQQRNKKAQPYLTYRTMRDEHVRKSHAAWDGLVLPVDHNFWDTHMPQNGWRCRCRVFGISERALQRMREDGADVKTEAPPDVMVGYRDPVTGDTLQTPVGVDPGFGYNPGKARLQNLEQALARAQRKLDGMNGAEGGAGNG